MTWLRWTTCFGGLIGLFCLGLLAVSSARPGGLQTATEAPKEIVVGKVDQRTAQGNRLWIEKRLAEAKGRPVFLPKGEIQLDQALMLRPEHSGATLQGVGKDTVLRNAYRTGNYPLNGTFVIFGEGTGYADPMDSGQGTVATMPAKNPADGVPLDLTPYQPGRVVWGYRWNAYETLPEPPYKRYVVKEVIAARRNIVFDRAVDPELKSLKWSDGSPIQDPAEGSLTVTLETPRDAQTVSTGRWIYVSDGPSLAHEARGEYRRVISTDAKTGVVTLDRPLRRSYKGAAMVRVRPVADVTLRDMTFAQPPHGMADPFLAKFCTNLRLERVRIGQWGEPTAGAWITTSGHVEMVDCETVTQFTFNTVHDVEVRRGRYAGIVGEEGCFDVQIRDALIAPPGGVPLHGVKFYIGSDRITVADCRIEGCGAAHPAGGAVSPLTFGGRGCVVRNVRISNSVFVPGYTSNYLSGDGLRIEGLESDVPLSIVSGQGVRILESRVRAWDLRAGTTGRLANCEPVPTPLPAGWRVDGASDSK